MDHKDEHTEHSHKVRTVLSEIQKEWESNEDLHKERHSVRSGIRSSQFSALVSYLIKRGVIEV